MTSRAKALEPAKTIRGPSVRTWICLLVFLPLFLIAGQLVLSRAIHGTGVLEELAAFGWSYAYLFGAVIFAVVATGAVLSRLSPQPMRPASS